MAQNFKKLMKRFNKLPLLCKIAGIVVLTLVIKLVVDCLSRKVEGMSNPKELIYFYWDKCGHCKQFNPEWEKFEKTYNGPVKLNKKEMNEAGPELKKYNVNAFPTIIIIDETGDYKQYDGPRTSEGLLQYFSN